MLEISCFSMFAWAAVFLFQAVVHYSLTGRRRHEAGLHDEVSPNERRKLVGGGDEHASDECANPLGEYVHVMLEDSDEDYDSLDDDERKDFLKRISQTGSEMMSSCMSLEAIVQEQIKED